MSLNEQVMLHPSLVYVCAQGLYPESHGIVGNFFFDTELNDSFMLGGANQNDPKWWLGEPVSGH